MGKELYASRWQVGVDEIRIAFRLKLIICPRRGPSLSKHCTRDGSRTIITLSSHGEFRSDILLDLSFIAPKGLEGMIIGIHLHE